MGEPEMKAAYPDNIEVELTLTLPLHAWKHIVNGGNWNPFREAIADMVERFAGKVSGTPIKTGKP